MTAKKYIMPSALIAIGAALIGASMGPVGLQGAVGVHEGEPAGICEQLHAVVEDELGVPAEGGCQGPEAGIGNQNLAEVACSGSVTVTKETEVVVSEERVLWILYTKKETREYVHIHISYSFSCAGALQATISGDGGLYRTVSLDTSRQVSSNSAQAIGNILAAHDITGQEPEFRGGTFQTTIPDEQRRCSYSGLPGDTGCRFEFVAEPMELLTRSESGVDEVPVGVEVCMSVPSMTAHNRPDYAPLGVIEPATSASSQGANVCQDAIITWETNSAALALFDQAYQNAERGEATPADNELIDLAQSLGLR